MTHPQLHIPPTRRAPRLVLRSLDETEIDMVVMCVEITNSAAQGAYFKPLRCDHLRIMRRGGPGEERA